jgi:hypothetical protein
MSTDNTPAQSDEKALDALWKEMDANDPNNANSTPVDAADDEAIGDDRQAPVETAPAGEPAGQRDDLWANVPSAARAAYEESERQRQSLEDALKRDRGQISALQRRLKDQRSEPPVEDPFKPDAIAQVANEYPEVVNPLVKQTTALNDRLSRIESAINEDAARQTAEAQRQEVTRLEQMHPGWVALLKERGAAYTAWLESQPRHIREASERNFQAIVDADETADVIGRFKQHLGIVGQQQPSRSGTPPTSPTSRRSRQLDAVTDISGRPPPAQAGYGGESDDDLDREWRRMNERDARAEKEGRLRR